MRVTPRQFAQAVHELLVEKGASSQVIFQSFQKYLVQHGLGNRLWEMFSALEGYADEQANQEKVQVRIALPLGGKEKKLVEHTAARLFHKKTLAFHFTISPELLGGLSLETDNLRYDGSLRRKLNKLTQIL